mgnify:CR=1 FL=1|tara:strand:+ start:739 stop:885 length:147 start_codon:yes stop_codon:yes gene_type:complete
MESTAGAMIPSPPGVFEDISGPINTLVEMGIIFIKIDSLVYAKTKIIK